MACVCMVPAFAADDASALTKAKLLNTNWAVNCAKPADGNGNYHLSYSVSAKGVAVEILRTGPGADKSRELRNVQIISDEWLLYTMTDQDGEHYDILTRRNGDRKKSWRSIWKGGEPLILEGKFADGGGQPPWFERCK